MPAFATPKYKPGQYRQIFGGGQVAESQAKTTVNNPYNKLRKQTTRTVHNAMSNINSKFRRDPLVMGLFGRGGATSAGGLVGRIHTRTVQARRLVGAAGEVTRRVAQSKVARGIGHMFNKVTPPKVRKLGLAGMILTGATAMIGVGMMRGAMSAANDIAAERYMQDQRYTRNVLMNTRVGHAMTNQRNTQYGQLAGLAQALSANRHGRGM